MNILLVHQYYLDAGDPGISRFNQFVKYWRKEGHAVTVICGMVHYMTGVKHIPHRNKLFVRERGEYGETVMRCHVSESYNKNFFGRLWAYFSFVASSVIALFFIPRIDIVIATSPPLFVGITGVLASLFFRIPFIFEVRDLWPESAIELGVLKSPVLIWLSYRVEAFLYARAKKINVLTPAFRETLIVKKHVAPDKIFFIPNGADEDLLVPTKHREEIRALLGIPQDACVILYIGAHGIANHLDHILDAALRLAHYPKILFLLIGTGMQKKHLQERTAHEKISNVLFLDPQPKNEIANYICASDAGCAVLKKIEIFKTVYPNKVFDYMICKKPVLIGIDGIARTLVEQAGAGVYAEPENIQAFVDAAILLSQSPEERTQMGARGYEYVKKHFSREALASDYMGELKKILSYG